MHGVDACKKFSIPSQFSMIFYLILPIWQILPNRGYLIYHDDRSTSGFGSELMGSKVWMVSGSSFGGEYLLVASCHPSASSFAI